MTQPRQCDIFVAEAKFKRLIYPMKPLFMIQATKLSFHKLWGLTFSLPLLYQKSCNKGVCGSSGLPEMSHSGTVEDAQRAPSEQLQQRLRVLLAGLGECKGQGGSHDSFGILRGWCAASPCRQGVNESSDMSYWSTYVPRFSQTSSAKGQTV